MKLHKLSLMILALVCYAVAAQAITIETVPVGNVGNAPDPATANLYGSVNYAYSISKYEITAGQYTEFLNAVAGDSDPYGLYNSNMATTIVGSQIIKSGGVYTAMLPNQPVTYVCWGDAARFCNWLQTGSTENGAYTLDGHTDESYLETVTRAAGAKYVIPSEDEWYKAAYYDPNKSGGAGYWTYPTKSDTAPINTLPDSGNNANFYDRYGTGNHSWTCSSAPWTTDVGSFVNSLSAYGTLDQGGNVSEWTEAVIDRQRVIRGGSAEDFSDYLASSNRHEFALPAWESGHIYGFRVALVGVPEPGGLAMLAGLALTALLYYWRKRA